MCGLWFTGMKLDWRSIPENVKRVAEAWPKRPDADRSLQLSLQLANL